MEYMRNVISTAISAIRLRHQRHRACRLHNAVTHETRLPGDLRAIGKADRGRVGFQFDLRDAKLRQCHRRLAANGIGDQHLERAEIEILGVQHDVAGMARRSFASPASQTAPLSCSPQRWVSPTLPMRPALR